MDVCGFLYAPFLLNDVKGVRLHQDKRMDSGPVVIDIAVFQACAPSAKNRMTSVATSFIKQHACFRETHRRPLPPKREHQPRIGNRELSREAVARKDFLAFINKLSPQNACSITQQAQASLRGDFIHMYVDMLWDAMLRAPDFQVLYIDLLVAIDKKHSVFGDIQRIWDGYLHTCGWNSAGPVGSYDEFCDHVKSKKRAIASVRAWIQLTERHLCSDDVASVLLEKLVESGPVDATLDGIAEYCRAQSPLIRGIQKTLQAWYDNAQQLPPMTRFKLYDIWDNITKK